MPWEAIDACLAEALAGLDAPTRNLIAARFLSQTPLQEIAADMGVSTPTACRRVRQALARLRDRLADLGFERPEDAAAAARDLDRPGGLGRPGLGAAVAAEAAAESGILWEQQAARGSNGHLLHAGRRPIRIGVMISYLTLTTPNFQGLYLPAEHQLIGTPLMLDPAFRLLSVVEPGSGELGPVEAAVRKHNLLAGMIDATDARALQTLDVIYCGTIACLPNSVLDAVAQAVASGVGLFHKGVVGAQSPGRRDPRVCRLLLTDAISEYHTPGVCGRPMGASVLRAHPIIPGLAPGDAMPVSGCGMVFWPDPAKAQVLVAKDDLVMPILPLNTPLRPGRMPVVTAGQFGKGRVAMVGLLNWNEVGHHPSMRGDMMSNIMHWLAGPRLEQRAAWGL
ncbi:MAG: sigma-70 family RNA polymerase sigma factor [Planctomycetota bacterium]|nr:sigma-70 family RNA polymerase sigma factor [Planctomycetota bacterium]